MRAVIVGASSGLGRCIGIGLAQRGAQVALLARRRERLERAAREAGSGALAIECDVTDADSCRAAITAAARALGGIDALVYAPAVGHLARLVDIDADAWRRSFDTNVVGASLMTAAAIPHLTASGGRAVYLSSVSASVTPPWPGLGAYVVTKAALDKLARRGGSSTRPSASRASSWATAPAARATRRPGSCRDGTPRWRASWCRSGSSAASSAAR